MEVIGRWKGAYTYLRPARFAEGRGSCTFTLVVDHQEGLEFDGFVHDEVAQGGHPYRGHIEGRLASGGQIIFSKDMPCGAVMPDGTFDPDTGSRYRIHYRGVWDGVDTFRGTWNIRFGFISAGRRLYVRMPSSGTWHMGRSDYAAGP